MLIIYYASAITSVDLGSTVQTKYVFFVLRPDILGRAGNRMKNEKTGGYKAHVCMIAVCPSQRTVDYLDSARTVLNEPRAWTQLRKMFTILAQHLRRAFIPSEWRWRAGGSPLQRGPHCGIYTMTNAFCLAFGYKLWNFHRDLAVTRDMLLRGRRITTDFLSQG